MQYLVTTHVKWPLEPNLCMEVTHINDALLV